MIGFPEVLQTLEAMMGQGPVANHGAFWRGKSREEFVASEIFGLPMVVPGNPEQSALLRLLRGSPPFGPLGNDPGDRAASSDRDIAAVSEWIAYGCPEYRSGVGALAGLGVRDVVDVTDDVHVRYWRGVDFFFLPGLSSAETSVHVGRTHIRAYRNWHASRLAGQDPSVWQSYMADAAVQESFRYIRHHQTRLIEEAYGASQANLFDSLWKFGANQLPPDPQIAIPSERTMNSPYDWFFWVPYMEMSLHAADIGDADLRLARAWQVGVAADGLMRGRLVIDEFDAGAPTVDQSVKAAYEATQKDELIAGMVSRAQAFASSPFFEGWPIV